MPKKTNHLNQLQVSATSKKIELKLTQVARASLEQLKLDYEDFLRQRGLAKLNLQHPVLTRFKALNPQTLDQVKKWVKQERKRLTGRQGPTRTVIGDPDVPDCASVREGQCQSMSSACLAANAALSLLNLACYFLDRQVARLAQDFENKGCFTERLYRVRSAKRRRQR